MRQELGYDQLWLMAVDVGDGLTAADAYAVRRFRENGGGVLTARDHQDLGCCLSRLGSLGVVNMPGAGAERLNAAPERVWDSPHIVETSP